MPRSLVSRSLEPLVAVLWSIFIVWTAWLAVVWILPVGASALGLADGAAVPKNEDLRRAALLLANHADLVWLALAAMNLHLQLTRAHGLRTAREWLAFSAGGALVIALVNMKTGVVFGSLYFGAALGAKFLGVALGWVLLWAVLVIGARGAVLWMRPRASHALTAILTAVAVLITVSNLEWSARFVRGWWVWQQSDLGGVPWQFWVTWFVGPGLMAFAMREKDVASAAAGRSTKPVFVLAALNVIALAARLRMH